jgi:hypothetical protein
MSRPRRIQIASLSEVLAGTRLDARTIQRTLISHGDFRGVIARPGESAGYWVPRSWRGGIYFLDTGDGFAYVGQTTDMAARLNSHRKTWPTLRAVCFLPSRQADLLERERALLNALHGLGIPLWNKTLVDLIPVPTALDEHLPICLHERWLTDVAWNIWSGDRRHDPDQRLRYKGAYEAFAALPEFAALTERFRRFVALTVPALVRTEQIYWSVTCRKPSREGPFIRLNVGHQATLDGFRGDARGRVVFRLWIPEVLAVEALDAQFSYDRYGEGTAHLAAVGLHSWFGRANLVAAGTDQILLDITGATAFDRLLQHEPFVLRMRRMHLGLMQRGKNLNKRAHCLDLADHLVEPVQLGPADLPKATSSALRVGRARLQVS